MKATSITAGGTFAELPNRSCQVIYKGVGAILRARYCSTSMHRQRAVANGQAVLLAEAHLDSPSLTVAHLAEPRVKERRGDWTLSWLDTWPTMPDCASCEYSTSCIWTTLNRP